MDMYKKSDPTFEPSTSFACFGINDLKNDCTKNVVEKLDDALHLIEIKFLGVFLNRWKDWAILPNMGYICKIFEKHGWLFATHYFTNYSYIPGNFQLTNKIFQFSLISFDFIAGFISSCIVLLWTVVGEYKTSNTGCNQTWIIWTQAGILWISRRVIPWSIWTWIQRWQS